MFSGANDSEIADNYNNNFEDTERGDSLKPQQFDSLLSTSFDCVEDPMEKNNVISSPLQKQKQQIEKDDDEGFLELVCETPWVSSSKSSSKKKQRQKTTKPIGQEIKVEPFVIKEENEASLSSFSSASFSSAFTSTTTTEVSSTEYTSTIKDAADFSRKMYSDSMRTFLRGSSTFYEESVLFSRHEKFKMDSIEFFISAYEKIKPQEVNSNIKMEVDEELNDLSNFSESQLAQLNNKARDECYHVTLSDLNDEIEKLYEDVKEKNELKQSKFNSSKNIESLLNLRSEAEKLYTNEATSLFKSCQEESELKLKEKKVYRKAVDYFEKNVDSNKNPELIKKLKTELKESIEKLYKSQLKLFRLERDGSKLLMTAAEDTVRNYYNEEMEKRFPSKSTYVEPPLLFQWDEEISKATIKYTKGKNEHVHFSSSQLDKLKEVMKTALTKFENRNRMNITTKELAIGIDLGTTYSCVAVYRNGKAEVILNENGNKTTPSYVAFQKDGEIIVGDEAKEKCSKNPENTIFDAKRMIGRSFNDKNVQENIKSWPFEVVEKKGMPKIRIHSCSVKPGPACKKRKVETKKTFSAEEISAHVLKKMKKIAEDYLGCEVKNAVITVPAMFNNAQREATRIAGGLAGLNVMRILNEPTAAAIAYRLDEVDDRKKNVLVFDLGGGTFDVAILSIDKGKIDVKSVHGNGNLGGQDFDNEMIKYCMKFFKDGFGVDLPIARDTTSPKERFESNACLRRIRNECEKRKIALSQKEKVLVYVATPHKKFKHLDLKFDFTRQLFEDLNKGHFEKCIEIVKDALSEAKMTKSEIDEVILTGGSTRIPLVKDLLRKFFDGKVLSQSINADEAVAIGAAIDAVILNGQQVEQLQDFKLILKEVTSHSIGIRSRGNVFIPLIPKNSDVPNEVTTTNFSAPSDFKNAVRISIFEGEEKIADNNTLLGRFDLTDIPCKENNEEKLEVTMKVDREGILTVSAKCLSNQKSNEISINSLKMMRMSGEELEDAKDFM